MGLLLMLTDLTCSEDGSVLLESSNLVSTSPHIYDNCNLSPQMLNSCYCVINLCCSREKQLLHKYKLALGFRKATIS